MTFDIDEFVRYNSYIKTEVRSVRRDVPPRNGRIENRVKITDGTAAVSGLKLSSAQAGHWRDPRRRRQRSSRRDGGRESEELLQDRF